ncbi:hypothetical protein AB5J72_30540 [Streptomyces sp. CG1]|uniref:hypothetical protein n=1 Tax=Streptomyces sp. CG1 TaxID=1287523 RepID=UPI0034E1C27C
MLRGEATWWGSCRAPQACAARTTFASADVHDSKAAPTRATRISLRRLNLPEKFRVHDWRHDKVTNDLDAGKDPAEVSANVRHHTSDRTLAQHGTRRVEGARRPASGTARRIVLERIT